MTGFTEANGWTDSTLQASNGGTVNDGSLPPVEREPDDRGPARCDAQITSNGPVAIDADAHSAHIVHRRQYHGQRGATLSLPGLTGYTGNGGSTTLEATGAGTALTLANLSSVTQDANNYQAQTQFEALAGGTVTLSALKTINTGTVILESDGTGSVLNVPALTGFTEANGWTDSTLQASSGGTVNDGSPGQLVGREPDHRRDLHDRDRPAHVVYRRDDRDQGGIAQLRRADVVQRRQHHGQRRCDAEPAGGDELRGQRRRPRWRRPARGAH